MRRSGRGCQGLRVRLPTDDSLLYSFSSPPSPPLSISLRITGFADSSRVPGTVRFTVTDSRGDTTFDPTMVNMTHEVRSFWFGPHKLEPYMAEYLLKYNQGSPYERSLKLVDDYKQAHRATRARLSYVHYVKTVMTSMMWQDNTNVFSTYEMSVNTNQFAELGPLGGGPSFPAELPSVAFKYDLSPVQIVIREERETLFRFLVNLCAILGGVYTVASMLDGEQSSLSLSLFSSFLISSQSTADHRLRFSSLFSPKG